MRLSSSSQVREGLPARRRGALFLGNIRHQFRFDIPGGQLRKSNAIRPPPVAYPTAIGVGRRACAVLRMWLPLLCEQHELVTYGSDNRSLIFEKGFWEPPTLMPVLEFRSRTNRAATIQDGHFCRSERCS